MPRNRKRRSPVEPVVARVQWRTATILDVQCGCCGQPLPSIMVLSPTGALMMEHTNGWRWDGAAWRPTTYHREHRQFAREAAAHCDSDARERLHRNAFARTHRDLVRYGGAAPSPKPAGSEVLPTRVQCARCDAENDVGEAENEVDKATR